MAFDAPRKTLDEIRREIDLEFAGAAIPPAASDGDIGDRSPVADTDDDAATQRFYAALAARAERKLRRPSRRGSYLVAGVIGCIVGQIVLLGFMAAMRHRADSGTGSIAAPAERVAAMPPSSTPALSETSASRGSLAPAEAPTPSAPPRVTPPTEVAEPTAAATQSVVPTRGQPQTVATSTAVTAAPETPTSPPVSSPPPSVSSAMAPLSISSSTPAPASASSAPAPASVVKPSEPMPRQVVKQASAEPSSRPSVSAAPSGAPARPQSPARPEESQNWAVAQQEVRAALSEWLGASGRADDSIVSDAVVILSADGRTARTQVPTRRGARVFIREQRWEWDARGWTFIDDRDAWQDR